MAYADKITNMRRMALIIPNHNIVWEGVKIEGCYLLRRYGDGALIFIDGDDLQTAEEKLQDLCEDYSEDYILEVKYQDEPTTESWEPRK
jgi:hypothetical protein